MNTAQQDNAHCIPKALWEQLPPCAKSATSISQHHTKQQGNSATVHSNDHTDHSVANTLFMYASISVHHKPTKSAPTFKSTTLLNSLMSSQHSTAKNIHSVIISYAPMVVHTLLIWPMSPTSGWK